MRGLILPTSVAIRPAGVADAADLAQAITDAFAEYRGKLVPESGALAESADSITAKLAEYEAAIAHIDGVLAGCVLFRPDPVGLYLGRLAVLPEWRGKGVARALIAHVEAVGRGRGVSTITLSVRIALPGNQALFQACGFFEVAREAHPGFAEPTFIRMEKSLG